jgi:two-component system, NarL family, response regulator DevR
MRSEHPTTVALGHRRGPMQQSLLDLIAEGLTNRQIGERLFLAEKTVKNYVSNLLSKLGMERRTEAAVFATKLSTKRKADTPPDS